MDYKYECKVVTNWSIKRETFIEILYNRIIYTEDLETTISGYKYYFVIEKFNGNIAIYIYDDEDMENTKVKELTLTIPSADYKGDLSTPANVPEGHYFHGFINTEILKFDDILDPAKNYFVDDIFTLEFRGTLERKEMPVIKSLNQILWDSKANMDFTFFIGARGIKAHKFILRRYSSIFARLIDLLFCSLVINDFDYGTVIATLQLCYGIKFNQTIDRLFDCIKLTDVYEMPIIKEQIAHQLIQEVNSENVCEFANKSVEFKCPTLKGYCINYILKCIKEGKTYNNAMNLNAEIVQEIYQSSLCHTVAS